MVAGGLWRNERGEKFRMTAYAIYRDIYFKNTNGFVRGLHGVASFLKLVPSEDAVFEKVYPRLVSFFWRVIFSRVLKLSVLALILIGGGFYIKYAVKTEFELAGLLDFIVFPFKYIGAFVGEVLGR